MDAPETFQGDFSTMWRLGVREPLWHLTWDWWWLVMIDDPEGESWGKQLMVLWSTKDNDRVEVNGTPWTPSDRPGFDEHGGMLIDGMVCAWWFDGQHTNTSSGPATSPLTTATCMAGSSKATAAARRPRFPTTSRWACTVTGARFGSTFEATKRRLRTAPPLTWR